jgi:hypothetical protein
MTPEKKRAIEEIFSRYDYSLESSGSMGDEYLVFQLRIGAHLSREIVFEGRETRSVENLMRDYQRAGFACKARNVEDLEALDYALFREFFAQMTYRKRMLELYDEFSRRVEQSVGPGYSYKTPRFRAFESVSVERKTGTGSLLEEVWSSLNSDKPALVILEAPAGFGKTCTAFELTRRMASDESAPLPLISELSRNRMAKEFRYVLLDEFNRNFRFVHASAELVRYQIHKGRIVVMLDGFDELLHEGKEGGAFDAVTAFERVEPMLATVRDLLSGNASVVITTRKTSLLSGGDFHEWLHKNESSFHVTRFVIDQMRPEDWVDQTRVKRLREAGFPVDQSANPVLFSFIASLSDDSFDVCCEEPERMVGSYFRVLLEREVERQDLRMGVMEQKMLLQSIARQMIADDFTTESRDYFKKFLQKKHGDLLQQVRSRYSSGQSTGGIIEKLLHHAMLDRSAKFGEQIGFANDFILGTLAGDALVLDYPTDWLMSEYFVDVTVTAYQVRSQERREFLWKVLQYQADIMGDDRLLSVDLSLKGAISRDLCQRTFRDAEISDLEFAAKSLVIDCIFVGCRFDRVKFFAANMDRLQFVECKFYGCEIVDEGAGHSEWVEGYLGCQAEPHEFLEILAAASKGGVPVDGAGEREVQSSGLVEFERRVLERFWSPGRPNASPRRAIRTLYMGSSDNEYGAIREAIGALESKGYISIRVDSASLNFQHMKDIRRLLGR